MFFSRNASILMKLRTSCPNFHTLFRVATILRHGILSMLFSCFKHFVVKFPDLIASVWDFWRIGSFWFSFHIRRYISLWQSQSHVWLCLNEHLPLSCHVLYIPLQIPCLMALSRAPISALCIPLQFYLYSLYELYSPTCCCCLSSFE